MRPMPTVALAMLALSAGGCVAEMPAEYVDLARPVAAIAPTPIGTGHLGIIESGVPVQLRFPVPAQKPLAAALNLGNIVGFTGNGTSYQLVLRRDAADGPIIYEGPVIADGDEWNATNRAPVDVTAALNDADLRRGYLDVYATGIVAGDGWTVYRHDPGRREITISLLEATPGLRRTIEALAAMRIRGVAVIPMPQQIVLHEGELTLTADSRIILDASAGEDDRFAAEDLAEQIREAGGPRPAIVAGAAPRPGDIVLTRAADLDATDDDLSVTLEQGPEGAYVATVADVARVVARAGEGIWAGAQTLAQLATDGRIPRCEIADWPAYPVRGLQYDVARGQTVEVEWWERVIRALGRCKLNLLVIYGEDDYRFERFPFLGREGTFTPEKARALSEYAHRYHVQLVPQFESLGHASAVLRHEELADLREAGGAWVFCTCNPKTWEFLDAVYAELAEQFPYARYLHVGGDEFEGGFGKCEACRARIAAEGRNALYAEHMNGLADLCRKHGRTMLFWPSHERWTIEAADLLDKSMIPTEWIYHGPREYPQIAQYQALGFADVWASPAVVCFSRIWPDYPTTWRGIRGFLQAGADRGLGGCMTTTWEWRHGGLVTNSLPGMVYAAECAWSLGRTPVSDFERRYAQWWLGLIGEDAGERLHAALIEPWPRDTPAAICYEAKTTTDLWWASPRTVLRTFALKDPRPAEATGAVIAATDAALARLDDLEADATRNADLLAHTRLALEMVGLGARKLVAMQAAAADYHAARRALPGYPATAAERVRRCADGLRALAPPLADAAESYAQAARQVGAAMDDLTRIRALHDDVATLADDLDALAEELRAGTRTELPDGAQFGFPEGDYVPIGHWEPAQMSEEGAELRYDVTAQITAPGTYVIEWEYTRGAHGLTINRTALLADGEPVAVDEHAGWTGAGSRDNLYHLRVDEVRPGARYEVVGTVASRGGTDSRGDVWLITGAR